MFQRGEPLLDGRRDGSEHQDQRQVHPPQYRVNILQKLRMKIMEFWAEYTAKQQGIRHCHCVYRKQHESNIRSDFIYKSLRYFLLQTPSVCDLSYYLQDTPPAWVETSWGCETPRPSRGCSRRWCGSSCRARGWPGTAATTARPRTWAPDTVLL